MSWNFTMQDVLACVGAITRGKVTRAGEIEVQCPNGVCNSRHQPVWFSCNLSKGTYNCFHCCTDCPYKGGMIDLFCMFSGVDPNDRKEAKRQLSIALDGGVSNYKPREIFLLPEPENTRSDEDLDLVYRTLLSKLTLNPSHRDNLHKRGLSDEEIDRAMYRSLPEKWGPVFVELKKALPGETLEGIPGFYTNGGKVFSAFTKSGFFVPYFNERQMIVGMQVRFDQGEHRYLWFSSTGYPGGARSRNIASYGIPGAMPKLNSGTPVYVTEGALKAHIACVLSGGRNPYIALAGVNCFNQWENACTMLRACGVTQVIDAFDSDRETNEHVRNALARLYEIAQRYGITMRRFNWGTKQKGVDDYYLAVIQGKAFVPFIPREVQERACKSPHPSRLSQTVSKSAQSSRRPAQRLPYVPIPK